MKCPFCDGSGHLDAATTGALVMTKRKSQGLTQIQLAERCGLSRGQIANIEVDRSDIPLKTLARIAASLECSMKDLVP
jgi:transcriptional regulator with XRE-family HTH domain